MRRVKAILDMKQRSLYRKKNLTSNKSFPSRTVAVPKQMPNTCDICGFRISQWLIRLTEGPAKEGFPLLNSLVSLPSEVHWGALPGLGRLHQLRAIPFVLCCATQNAFTSSYWVHALQSLETISSEPDFLLTFFFIPWLHNMQVGKWKKLEIRHWYHTAFCSWKVRERMNEFTSERG